MIRFTVRTDCHVHDKAPQSRIDDYLQTCLSSLRQIGHFAKMKGCDAVLDNGDFFHAKAASKNSHLMVRSVIDLHREYSCPVYCNPGNHDFPYNNIEYLDRQPLGVLFAAGIFERMLDHTFEDGEGLQVRVVGFPYKPLFTVDEFNLERGDEDVLIVCAHTFASMNGGDLFGNEVSLSYIDLAHCSPDVFIFGHWHIDQGIEKVNGKYFLNLGSMTRGSLVKDNLTRIPRFGYIEVKKSLDGVVSIHTEAIPLDVPPASEVFDLERSERLVREDRNIENFVQTLRSQSVQEGLSMAEEVSSLSHYHDEVRQKALYYLNTASEG